MAVDTKIQWCHHTFNPWRGCTKVNQGCTNCYAEVNYSVKMHGVKWGPNGTRIVASENYWKQPETWNRKAEKAGERRRVFCASLADVFEDWRGPMLCHDGRALNRCHCGVTYPAKEGDQAHCYGPVWPLLMDDVRRLLFALIDRTPHLDWLVLTKRPENIRRMWIAPPCPFCDSSPCDHFDECGSYTAACYWESEHKAGRSSRYRDNVWLLTSVSDQETADKAIPELLKCRDLVPVLGVSAEPLLGPVDLANILVSKTTKEHCGSRYNALSGLSFWEDGEPMFLNSLGYGPSIDWLIVGGESGPKARECKLEWIRPLVRQCRDSGTACFLKQLGSRPCHTTGPLDYTKNPPMPTLYTTLDLRDPKGGNPSEWPEDLRVREFPKGVT